MIDGRFLVTPLAEDGKIAIGHRTVGVRVKMLGTELSCTIMNADRPFWELKLEAQAAVEKQFNKIVEEFRASARGARGAHPWELKLTDRPL